MNFLLNKTVTLNSSIHRIFVITASLLIIIGIVIATFVITPPAFASELDDFEEAATIDNPDPKSDIEKKKEAEKDEEESQDDYHCDFFGIFFQGFFQDMMNSLFSIVSYEAKLSYDRIVGPTDPAFTEGIEIRETGEPTLPFFQMDTKFLYINPDIFALDECFELGYAALGFEYRNTSFIEVNPIDNLSLTQYHLLLRFSKTGSLEYGIGTGKVIMNGNEQNSGYSVTYPIKIYPAESLGVKIKPTYSWINDNCIRDYDISLVFSQRFGTLELGRRFLEVNGVDLSGSYIGVALHY